jgi:hypothetical protein
MLEIADQYEQIAHRAEERIREVGKRPAAPSIRHSRPTTKKRWF